MIDDVEAFVNVAQILHDRGAYKIYVVATHGLLSADAPRHIEDSFIDEVCIWVACHMTNGLQWNDVLLRIVVCNNIHSFFASRINY